jgi:hypothetical protein
VPTRAFWMKMNATHRLIGMPHNSTNILFKNNVLYVYYLLWMAAFCYSLFVTSSNMGMTKHWSITNMSTTIASGLYDFPCLSWPSKCMFCTLVNLLHMLSWILLSTCIYSQSGAHEVST